MIAIAATSLVPSAAMIQNHVRAHQRTDVTAVYKRIMSSADYVTKGNETILCQRIRLAIADEVQITCPVVILIGIP